ncbi:MAG: hypothetical protein E7054_02400 [Lentisphaerae bacterium]|nr:hypothetical protein [Lentisphaerota bacterium]
MKKFISMLLLTLLALFAYAADYRVLVLGDLHYDAPEYHSIPNMKSKFKLRNDYIKMWKEKTPLLLTASAKQLDKDIPFIIQCGDFTQGDAVGGENQIKMFNDAFAKVKAFFPNHKLLPVKGNHDIRTYPVDPKTNTVLKRKNSNVHTDKGFTPFAAKELGKPVKDHYTVIHNNDLYIFYDGFQKAKNSIKFVKDTLAANPEVRNVFFITHLPVLPCSTGDPGWLLSGYQELAKILMSRNAVIFTAHTHQPSLVKVSDGKNTLTQMVFSSIGYAWSLGKDAQISIKTTEEFRKKLYWKKAKYKRSIAACDFLDSLKPEVFELYDKNANGFAIIKVTDAGVTAEIHNNDSGKPTLIKKLK